MSRKDIPVWMALRERVVFWVLTFFSVTLFFTRLGQNGMATYDDCFYAEEGKEILQTGQWQVLNYNHVASFHNAPLFMWLVALSDKLFGVGVFASKFPSALMGLLAVLLVYRLGREISGSWLGLISGLLLAANYLFLKYSRHCMLDVTVAFFTALALYAFLKALKGESRYYLLWGLGVGLAVLTKSAFGLYPALVAGLVLVILRKKNTFTNPYLWGGVLIFLSMAGAWVWTQWQAGGQDFVNVHLKFIIMGKIGGSDLPLVDHLSLLKDLFTYLWPWLPFYLFGFFLLIKREFKDKETSLLLLVWGLTLPILLTLMQTQFPFYMIQAFPAWALAGALGMGKLFQRQGPRTVVMNTALGLCVGVILLVNLLPIQLDRDREKDTRILAPYVKHFAEKGAQVVALREDYWSLNNALLFFSDHAAGPVFTDPAELKPLFGGKDLVLCLAHKGDLGEIGLKGIDWYPVKLGEDLILIANQSVNTATVKTWGGPWDD